MEATTRLVFITFLILSSVTTIVHGQNYEQKFLQPVNPNPEGVVVDPDRILIQMNENNAINLTVAEIMYTGSPAPRVSAVVGGAPAPTPVIFIREEDGRYFLVVQTSLDYEPMGLKAYSISLTPSAPNNTIIEVVDVNDNWPIINCDGGLQFEIPENTVNNSIHTYTATDADVFESALLTFIVEDSDQNPTDSPFQIDASSGVLSLKSETMLDYEKRTTHRLLISVIDSDPTHKVSCPIVTIVNVEDLPDLPPRWIQFVSSITIDEEGEIEEYPTYQYTASDQDNGVNSPIRYTVEMSSEIQPYFAINEATGELKVVGKIDVDAMENTMFQLDIIGTEELEPYESVPGTVFLTIQDVNDNYPEFGNGEPEFVFNVNIKEGYSDSSELPLGAEFIIHDNDILPTYNTYNSEIIAESFITDVFRITPLRGSGKNTAFSIMIQNRSKIDYEDELWRNQITFMVNITEAMDPVQNFATATIILQVKDVNDEDPRFEDLQNGELEISIPEDTKVDTVILARLNGIDDDISDAFGTASLRYKWYNRVPSHLELDEETGQITVIQENAFNYERQQEEIHIINVCDMQCESTEDDNFRSVTITLKILIQDINDESPTIYLPQIIPVKENDTARIDLFNGSVIIVGDPDTYPDLEIIFESTTSTDLVDFKDWFEFEFTNFTDTPEAGNVSYRISMFAEPNILDRELFDRVDFKLTVNDRNTSDNFMDKESQIAYFTVTILDINDNKPTFDDDNGTAFLSIRLRESTFEFGEADPETDYEREITTLRASDLDLNSSLNFTMTPLHPRMDELVECVGCNVGGVDRVTLRRKLGMPIDREESNIIPDEENTNYLVYDVTVSDGDLKSSITVNITIEDLNDNAPIFVNRTIYFEVSEDAEVNSTIATFLAVDSDAGAFGIVRYLLDETYNDGVGTNLFGIDPTNGSLYVKDKLDRETLDIYGLRIKAVDNYRPSTEVGSNIALYTIQVRLLDVNDNAPRFDPNAKLEDKNEDEINPGDNLGVINVYDDDINENAQLKFEILDVTCDNQNVANPKAMFTFANVPDNSAYPEGLRILANDTFVGKYGSYLLTLQAEDNGAIPLTANQTFEFNALDVNLNTPIILFPPPGLTVYISRESQLGVPLENYTGGRIDNVFATDEDSPATGNGLLRYALETNGDSTDYFEIRTDSVGTITVKQSLTDRVGAEFNVSINVSDRGVPPNSAGVILKIRLVPNVNSPPKFEPPYSTSFSVEENEPQLPARLSLPLATDDDFDDEVNPFNEQICYYIIGGDENQEFQLNSTTNSLSLRNEAGLDREAKDYYELRILAINERISESGLCSDTPNNEDENSSNVLTVAVNVTDVNDVAPIFQTNENGIISAGLKVLADLETLSLTVQADDPDLNDVITYSISSDITGVGSELPSGNVFSINPTTGVLQNLFQPQSSMSGYFTFTINATDSHTVNHTTAVPCKIYLITESHVVKFRFSNPTEYFDPIGVRNLLGNILSSVFEYTCNVERAIGTVDENGQPIADFAGRTTVETHFIDEDKSEAVDRLIILDAQFNSEKMNNLTTLLAEAGFIFYTFGEDQDSGNPLSTDRIMVYVLASGVAVLVVTLVVLGVTCWFNNRSLSRRVRALTASTFGSQQSGLNRAGGKDDMLPTTNQFAVQGSNPIWTTQGNTEFGEFDNESVGSGGSVLIGAEDEDYFDGKYDEENKDHFNSDSEDANYSRMAGPSSRTVMDDLPNPIGAVTRRNPLAGMNFEGNESSTSET